MNIDEQLKDLKLFNDLTEDIVSQGILKTVLGIPLKSKSEAKTFKAAYSYARQAEPFSEKHYGHVDVMIMRASTFSEGVMAYKASLPGSEQAGRALYAALILVSNTGDIKKIKDLIQNENVLPNEKVDLMKALIRLEEQLTAGMLQRSFDTETLIEHYELLSRHSAGRITTLKAFCRVATIQEMKHFLNDLMDVGGYNVGEVQVLIEGILSLHEQQKDLLAKSIEDVEMPTEVFNLLKSGNVNTLGELIELSADDLNKYRKLSRTKIKVVVTWLKTVRLELSRPSGVQL